SSGRAQYRLPRRRSHRRCAGAVARFPVPGGAGGGPRAARWGRRHRAFYGGTAAHTLLTRVTWWSAGIFLFLSLVLAIMSAQTSAPRSVIDTTGPQPAPVQPAPLPLQSTPQQTPPPQAPPPQPSGQRPPHR